MSVIYNRVGVSPSLNNPMQRNIDSLLAYELRRNSLLLDIYENLDSITREQLEDIRFPLKWIRDKFLEKKANLDILTRQEKAINRLDDLSHIQEIIVPDQTGQLIRWNGDDESFFRVDGGGQIGVLFGHYLFMPLSGGIYLDTLFTKHIDPKVYQDGIAQGQIKLSAYKQFVAEERNRRVSPLILSHQEADRTGYNPDGPMERLSGFGVRFS